MNRSLLSLATFFVALVAAPFAQAITLTFDENSIPTNPVNGFSSFTFDDFGAPGAVTESPTGIILDIVDSNGSNGVFGGVGVDYVVEDPPASGTFVPQDFDASTHRWEMRIRALANNTATQINTAFIDDDGNGTADDIQYNFDISGLTNGGPFQTLVVPMSSPGFIQGAFGFNPGD